MTPFGNKLVELRQARKMGHEQLARLLKMDPPKLTAMEMGFEGLPSPVFIFQVERALELSRFELEELKAAARLSNTQATITLTGMEADSFELANLLAQYMSKLPPKVIGSLLEILKKAIKKL